MTTLAVDTFTRDPNCVGILQGQAAHPSHSMLASGFFYQWYPRHIHHRNGKFVLGQFSSTIDGPFSMAKLDLVGGFNPSEKY